MVLRDTVEEEVVGSGDPPTTAIPARRRLPRARQFRKNLSRAYDPVSEFNRQRRVDPAIIPGDSFEIVLRKSCPTDFPH